MNDKGRYTRPFCRKSLAYAEESAVHPRTGCRLRTRTGRDGEAADQSSRPEYARLLHRIADRMKSIFATKGDVLLMGASGTGGLEAAVTNMFGPGDTLLACPTGVFGERIAMIAQMWGCTVQTLETPWGAGVDPEALAARLRADREQKITGILLTHNETSTGVQIDLGAMSRATGDHPAYVVVDSVSGLGASEFKMDEWKLDIVCAASQKALACPPGLAMVAVSPRE